MAIHVFYLASGSSLRFLIFRRILLDYDLASSIFLLKLFVTHLDEHIVIDLVWSATLKLSGDPRVDVALLSVILILWSLVLLLIMHISQIGVIFCGFLSLFIFLCRVTGRIEPIRVGCRTLQATETYA